MIKQQQAAGDLLSVKITMEDTAMRYSLFSLAFLLLVTFKLWLQRKTQPSNLPPSPPALPIIGHLHLLKQPLHRTLYSLSKRYGPIITLQLGARRAVVVSSPSAVEECFTKNDIVFANRPPLTIGKYLDYNFTSLVTSPYGEHWRNLRRLSAIDIFSSNRLNVFLSTRKDEIKILLQRLYSASRDGRLAVVELRPMFRELTFSSIMLMVAGNRYHAEQDEEAKKFRETIEESFKYGEASYPGDFFPILQWIDYQGFVKRAKKVGARSDEFFQGMIDEHRSDMCRSQVRDTMIGHLLSLQESQPEHYKDETIKGLIQNMIFAGTDTSAVTLEWAMANLLNNPRVLEKAKIEIDNQIGQERLIDESDLSNLPYLRNIISETLRLYPPGPMLLPHLSSDMCALGGYQVPSNTVLFVNAWAIHRNPELWEDAEDFKPERFEGGGGANDRQASYKFMPFGFGRRACPGMALANRVVGLTLGSLIQCIEWKRENDDRLIDMSEGTGLTMPKAEPLVAMCRARDHFKHLLSSV